MCKTESFLRKISWKWAARIFFTSLNQSFQITVNCDQLRNVFTQPQSIPTNTKFILIYKKERMTNGLWARLRSKNHSLSRFIKNSHKKQSHWRAAEKKCFLISCLINNQASKRGSNMKTAFYRKSYLISLFIFSHSTT